MEDEGLSQLFLEETQEKRAWSTEFHGLENILSRIPIFSVLRCRNVCKCWNQMICSWSFRRSWSRVNISDSSWILLIPVNWGREHGMTLIIFYNVFTHEWRLKEIKFKELLESNGHEFGDTDRLFLTNTTAKGLLVYVHDRDTHSGCERSLVVLNPLTNGLRFVAMPQSAAEHFILTSDVVMGNIADHDLRGPLIEGRQCYTVQFICYLPEEKEWSSRTFNSLTGTWVIIPLPDRFSEKYRRFQMREPQTSRHFLLQRCSKLHSTSSDWAGRIFHFALMVWGQAGTGDFKGFVDLISFDNDGDNSNFSLCIPWTWNCGNAPDFRLGIIQREDILVVPFIVVHEVYQFMAIKISTLEIRSESSEMLSGCGTWQIKAVMPHNLFIELHTDSRDYEFEEPCQMRYRLKCFYDERTDQILLFSNTGTYLQIVAYDFSPPSPDQEWVSWKYPLDTRLNEVLRLPDSIITLLLNFHFRPDSIP